jgi:aspartate/methionine/tyrosine aminotransferase
MVTPADRWIAERMSHIESSGIRRIFELAGKLKDPINLSIGQPDFDVPEAIKAAAHAAIDRGANGYTVTQGIAELRNKIQNDIRSQFGHADREVTINSGTTGALALALTCIINPGDEVIVFDPYFVIYPQLTALAGGKLVFIDTYPDCQIDVNRVAAAITPRTKAILVNSPANPTGVVHGRAPLEDLARLADKHGILLISDEIYRAFSYDGPFVSPAQFSENVLVIDGFSKTYGMTGWRLSYAHGPSRLISEMNKLQQFTFVCAPSIVQHAGLVAWDFDYSEFTKTYRRKRDRIRDGLKDKYEMVEPAGSFYLFAKAPWGTGSEFVTEAIRKNLLIIPGNVFSRRDTHFRLSYAASDSMIDRGIDMLNRLARR